MSTTSRNTLVTLSGNLLGMLLGMAVVVCVSARYGVGAEVDAFWTANTLPIIVGQVFLSVSLLLLSPAFVRERTVEGDEAAWKLGSTFLTGVIAVAALASVLLFIAAPWLVRVLAPGFGEATGRMATHLLRILSFSVVGLAMAGVGSSLLISNHRFAVAGLIRPISQICVLAAILVFSYQYGIRAYAYAVVGGSAVAALCVVATLGSYRQYVRPRWSWSHSAALSILTLLPMVLLARAVDHGNQVVTRAIGSTLPEGSISALAYAWAIFQVPGVLGASLGTVVFPQFSEKLASKKTEELVDQVVRCIRVTLLVCAPLATGLLLLSTPLIQVLLERGEFRHADTVITSRVLACYALGVFATSVNSLVGNLYWSLRQVRLRVLLEGVAIAIGLTAALLLSPRFGAAGLALSTSAMYIILTLAGIFVLTTRVLPALGWTRLVPAASRTFLSSLGMAVVVLSLRATVPGLVERPLVEIIVLGSAGLATYLALCLVLQREDARLFFWSLRSTMSGTRRPTGLAAPRPIPVGETGLSEVGR